MSSTKNADVDFERDLPTTAEDIEALERAREQKPLATDAYLRWISQMPKTPRPRGFNTDDDEPFEL